MFGRIRASPSSLETLEGSPSKLLKDDSFSVYEATLMKLKLGAQRDISASSSIEMDDSDSSSCVEDANVKSNCTPASDLGSQHMVASPRDGMMMDTDCSSISTSPCFSDRVSAGNSGQRNQNNVSILHFFKLKDPGHTSVSSCEKPRSTKDGSFGSISSCSVESCYRSEVDGTHCLEDCELLE